MSAVALKNRLEAALDPSPQQLTPLKRFLKKFTNISPF
jgi:hypothetical protein